MLGVRQSLQTPYGRNVSGWPSRYRGGHDEGERVRACRRRKAVLTVGLEVVDHVPTVGDRLGEGRGAVLGIACCGGRHVASGSELEFCQGWWRGRERYAIASTVPAAVSTLYAFPWPKASGLNLVSLYCALAKSAAVIAPWPAGLPNPCLLLRPRHLGTPHPAPGFCSGARPGCRSFSHSDAVRVEHTNQCSDRPRRTLYTPN